jgi:hypothetical protein
LVPDSPYGDVSGLPDPYTHRSTYPTEAPTFDDSHEDQANGRGGRRVIREIIV